MKFALLVEFDGTAFSGWQVQPAERTVQGELESAIRTLTGQSVPVIGSGRTDAGVHARGMVAHTEVDLSESLPLVKMLEALNALTPEDIIIRDIRPVNEEFHARFSAVGRTYRYRISTKRIALERDYFWQVRNSMDVESMRELLDALKGEHDFTSYSKLSDDVDHYRCTVFDARIELGEDSLIFWLSANRFVRGMVRALIGAIVEVGKGRLSKEEFLELLDIPKELDRARFISPAQGLTFWSVRYPEAFGLW